METLTCDEYFRSPDTVVTVLNRSPQQDFPEHVHEFDELVIARSGSGMNYIDGKPAPICRGTVFYVRPQQTHHLTQLEDLHLTNVLIVPSRFRHIAHGSMAELLARKVGIDGEAYVADNATLKRVEMLLSRIEEESDNPVEYSDQMVEMLLGQLMIEIWRGQPRSEDVREKNDARITAVLRHLNAHYDEEMEWEALAARFGVPLRTLSRKITDITGMSPNSYLNRIRLCHAMRMLRETELSVTDVAFACGFNDGNYFISRFHREVGTTPTQYRRQAAAGTLLAS
jgi:AraC family L-rhamnose operon regulatory protein RhaS